MARDDKPEAPRKPVAPPRESRDEAVQPRNKPSMEDLAALARRNKPVESEAQMKVRRDLVETFPDLFVSSDADKKSKDVVMGEGDFNKALNKLVDKTRLRDATLRKEFSKERLALKEALSAREAIIKSDQASGGQRDMKKYDEAVNTARKDLKEKVAKVLSGHKAPEILATQVVLDHEVTEEVMERSRPVEKHQAEHHEQEAPARKPAGKEGLTQPVAHDDEGPVGHGLEGLPPRGNPGGPAKGTAAPRKPTSRA